MIRPGPCRLARYNAQGKAVKAKLFRNAIGWAEVFQGVMPCVALFLVGLGVVIGWPGLSLALGDIGAES